jgi:hypothetical protein
VPDGSGALMRFRENSVPLSFYTGQVFGENPADAMFFANDDIAAVERPHPLMPVFGVTQGHDQQAFVAWAENGAEYMEIVMYPERNMTHYNFVYPRFVMNRRITERGRASSVCSPSGGNLISRCTTNSFMGTMPATWVWRGRIAHI